MLVAISVQGLGFRVSGLGSATQVLCQLQYRAHRQTQSPKIQSLSSLSPDPHPLVFLHTTIRVLTCSLRNRAETEAETRMPGSWRSLAEQPSGCARATVAAAPIAPSASTRLSWYSSCIPNLASFCLAGSVLLSPCPAGLVLADDAEAMD